MSCWTLQRGTTLLLRQVKPVPLKPMPLEIIPLTHLLPAAPPDIAACVPLIQDPATVAVESSLGQTTYVTTVTATSVATNE